MNEKETMEAALHRVIDEKEALRDHYDRGFADALRLAAEYVRAWEESPMLISQKMVDTLAAGIEVLTAALTPPQEKP